MSGRTKPELMWMGKERHPKLKPTILREDPERSYRAGFRAGDTDLCDNRLIHGDNLPALKALEPEFAGKIKCIYIDPPYNTGSSFEHYDDGLEHSLWLSLMRDRLTILRDLLADDGLIFVQIDDNEFAYLTLLMDEIFHRSNRVNTICVKMSEVSGVKMAHADKRLPKLKEYILVYKKKEAPVLTPELVRLDGWNNEYKTILLHFDKEDFRQLDEWLRKEAVTAEEVEQCNALLKKCRTQPLVSYMKENRIKPAEQEQWKFDNAWRIIQAVGSSSVLKMARAEPPKDQEIAATRSPTGILYLYKTDFDPHARRPRVQVIFAQHNLFRNPGDFWTDIKTTGGVGQEGGVLFPNGKKPEKLIKRIIAMCTKEGDWVLDAFAGSGTTGAVAHKMRRRWIMIEEGEHCLTHIVPRLKRVIDGTDQTGISKEVDWKGGGGFRYFRPFEAHSAHSG
jgi:adenine-specific DNA-methyltransferase